MSRRSVRKHRHRTTPDSESMSDSELLGAMMKHLDALAEITIKSMWDEKLREVAAYERALAKVGASCSRPLGVFP